MKNNIKKLIIVMFAFVLLFAGQSVFAANVFNGQSGDCNPAIGIGVYHPTSPTTGDWNLPTNGHCWTATTLNAVQGDTVNVAMYYHNNTANTLSGVKALITKSSAGPDDSYIFTGTMYSTQNGSQVSQGLGDVHLNINEYYPQTLTYVSSHWMKDADAVNNDEDTQVWTDKDDQQINIGYLDSDYPHGSEWEHYGVLLIKYKVGEDCSISSFIANPSTITSGGTSNLSWSTTHCSTASITDLVSVNPTSGSYAVHPTVSKTYTLSAQGSNGSTDTATATVNVSAQIDPYGDDDLDRILTGTLTSASSSCYIQEGNDSCNINFSWTTTNQPSGSVSEVTKDGVIAPVATANNGTNQPFSIDRGSNTFRLYNSATQLASRTVSGICESGTSWDGNSCESNDNSGIPEANTGSVHEITYNSAEINGSVDMNSFNNGIVFFVYGENESQVQDVEEDYSTYNSVNENGDNLQKERVDTDLDGSNSYALDISGLDNNDDYYYSICVQYYNGGNELICGSVRDFTAGETSNEDACDITEFYPNRTSIASGASVTLNWETDNCSSAYLSTVGNVNLDGSRTLYPTSTTNYTLSAYGSSGGTQSKTVQVAVTGSYNGVCGITSMASNVTKTSATLNGVTSSPNYSGANTYFEYGLTPSLGSKTPSRSVSGNTFFSENITGLIPGMTYYFRLVSNCQSGNAYGNITTLRTASNVVPFTPTPVPQNTYIVTNAGTGSPIMLKIENRFEFVEAGDNINYTITYKNIGKVTLKDSVIQVVVPKGIDMTKASRGTYSNDTHIFTIDLGELVKNAEGEIFLDADLDFIPAGTEKIVTTAVLVYTNPNGVQESATAYVLNVPKGDSNNFSGAAAALFGGIISMSLIGWLILILLVLIMILITRNVMQRKNQNQNRI
ncbi:MAG: hypothetical protein ABH951_01515 [Patescibacteria group bacterium]